MLYARGFLEVFSCENVRMALSCFSNNLLVRVLLLSDASLSLTISLLEVFFLEIGASILVLAFFEILVLLRTFLLDVLESRSSLAFFSEFMRVRITVG